MIQKLQMIHCLCKKLNKIYHFHEMEKFLKKGNSVQFEIISDSIVATEFRFCFSVAKDMDYSVCQLCVESLVKASRSVSNSYTDTVG